MRYRKEDGDGDYVFGSGSSFLIDSPEAVAQAVRTRIRLYTEEWFLDTRVGLDRSQILGVGTQATRDFEIQQRIINTQGVKSILEYGSSVEGRAFTVSAVIDTIYGKATINENIQT